MRRFNAQRGQTGTEYMLVVSVVVLTIVLTGYAFVPKFRTGVNRVGADVERMLSTGQRLRRVAPSPAPNTLPGGFRLPGGPRNSGCASSTACGNPAPRSNSPLGTPLNVCRPGDNC